MPQSRLVTDENRLAGRARRASRRILELVKKVREAAMLGLLLCLGQRRRPCRGRRMGSATHGGEDDLKQASCARTQ